VSSKIQRRTVLKGAATGALTAGVIMEMLRSEAIAATSARAGANGRQAFAANQTVTTLIPDRFYRIGCVVRAARLSWLPGDLDAYEPLNAYLLTDDDNCIFVDTGPAIMLPAIQSSLELIGDRKVWVYFTRNEADTIGNLGYVLGTCENPTMLFGSAGGVLEWVNDPAVSILEVRNFLGRIPVETARNGVSRSVGSFAFDFMEGVTKQMGMTQWAFEKSTGTLFTSESFGWHHAKTPDSPLVVESASNLPDADTVAREMVARCNWMREANFPERIELLQKVFRDREVQNIAPVHGAFIRGKKAVDAHLKLAVRAMQAAAKLPDSERQRYV
jgi:flavorubredoxin